MADWKVERKTANNFQLDCNLKGVGDKLSICLMADLHWDNPKCDRQMLSGHLDRAVADNMPIMLIGDTFCAMQGKYDKRACKSDVRPEHQHGNYLDRLVDTAVEFFTPYREHIVLIGEGNHETSILNKLETNLCARLAGGLRIDAHGGYGGYVDVILRTTSIVRHRHLIKYVHGWGGGGVVTKGTIQANRRQVMYPQADCIITGHIHEAYSLEYCVEEYNERSGKTEIRYVDHIQLATYKEEYGQGAKGWHVERGAPPKPLGCSVLAIGLTGKAFSKKTVDISRWR